MFKPTSGSWAFFCSSFFHFHPFSWSVYYLKTGLSRRCTSICDLKLKPETYIRRVKSYEKRRPNYKRGKIEQRPSYAAWPNKQRRSFRIRLIQRNGSKEENTSLIPSLLYSNCLLRIKAFQYGKEKSFSFFLSLWLFNRMWGRMKKKKMVKGCMTFDFMSFKCSVERNEMWAIEKLETRCSLDCEPEQVRNDRLLRRNLNSSKWKEWK